MLSRFINISIGSSSLSLFRICLGVCVIVDVALYKLPYYKIFYTNSGIITNEAISKITTTYWCSFLYYLNSDWLILGVFILTIFVAGIFAAGYKTRLFSIILYLLLFSIHERNAPFLFGSDSIFRLLVFFSIFLPLDEHYNFLNKKESKNSNIYSLATFGILFQISCIYFFNAIHKSGDSWKDGTAIAHAFMIPVHHSSISDFMLDYPFLYKTMTYVVRSVQLFIPLLIFLPIGKIKARKWAAITIFIFHWSILFFLDVGGFHLATLPIAVLLFPLNNVEEIQTHQAQKPILNSILTFSLIFILWINVADYSKINPQQRSLVEKSCNCFGLSQKWRMFSPNPSTDNGYIAIFGETEAGTILSIQNKIEYSEELLTQKPMIYKSFPSAFAYLSDFLHMFSAKPDLFETICENWISYELENWNKNKNSRKLKSVAIVRIELKTKKPGVYENPRAVMLYKKDLPN